MIALCGEHHAKADVGAYNREQLRELKQKGRERAAEVKGKFDWMRRQLLAVVGGNFYLDTPVIVQFKTEPAIWFNRDEEEYLLINFRMLTTSGQPRVRLEDNYWMPRGDPHDLACPPNGKRLRVSYANGDYLGIEFFELNSADKFRDRYPDGGRWAGEVPFPVTGVELTQRVGGTEIEFGPRETTMPGYNIFRNNFSRGGGIGLHLK